MSDDFRLQKLLPTLQLIKEKKGTTILLTHRGRPFEHDIQLSTAILVPWFERHQFVTEFASTLSHLATIKAQKKKNDLIILENIRFWPEEYRADKIFACSLAAFGSYYVNDAFGSLHRNHTSITTLALCFPPSHRSIGLLVEKEIEQLHKLNNPHRPFLVIVGGNKIKDKVPFLYGCAKKADIIALCPAIIFSFLARRHLPIGDSLAEPIVFDDCRAIQENARKQGTRLLFPIDYIGAKSGESQNDVSTKIIPYAPDVIINNIQLLSIGPETVHEWKKIIDTANTIFFNGPFGLDRYPESLIPLHDLLGAIANSSAYTVVAGGDSVAAIRDYGYADAISFLSTGGGATLAFISGAHLVGLDALRESTVYDCSVMNRTEK
jgi:phosphoglycerate kinase